MTTCEVKDSENHLLALINVVLDISNAKGGFKRGDSVPVVIPAEAGIRTPSRPSFNAIWMNTLNKAAFPNLLNIPLSPCIERSTTISFTVILLRDTALTMCVP
ncbi:MAG: hypothetical protein Q7U03_11825 [Syntrophales bacterium]|nr:hypothetical protein [Syntrophales bacterium]